MSIDGRFVRQLGGGWINLDFVKCLRVCQVDSLWEVQAVFEWSNWTKIGEADSEEEAHKILDDMMGYHES